MRTVTLVAHDVQDGGGMERAFAELVRRGRDECRFVVVSADLDPSLRPLVDWRRVPVPRRPIPLKSALFALLASVRLRGVRGDLVHSMGAVVPGRVDLATVQFCLAGYREATGSLAPPNAPLLRRANTTLARGLGLLLERRAYRPGRVRTLAVVSPGVAAEIGRHYPGVATTTTPNGVDLEAFAPDATVRAHVRRELGVRDDEPVSLFVGGDWDRKGLAIAIAALAEPGVSGRLWVVGRGDEARFGRLAGERGVGGRVRFLGPRADAVRFFQAADVFVLPTAYETFSNVAYEAAACGLPVVAPPVSGIADLLVGGTTGIAVGRDAAEVGAALAALEGDPDLRRRLGEAARRRASGYGWGASVAAVLALYRALDPAAKERAA